MKEFLCHAPKDPGEAVLLLRELGEEALLLAGGTDVVIQLQQEVKTPRHLVYLGRIGELKGIWETEEGGLEIGAMTLLRDIERSPLVKARAPLLALAAARVASPLVRNSATLGGNLCLDNKCWYYDQSRQWKESHRLCFKAGGEECHVVRGSDLCYAISSSDTAPALIALEAEVRALAPEGERTFPLHELYTGDGMRPIGLRPAEVLTRVRLPAPLPNSGCAYERLATRSSIDFAFASAAVFVALDGVRGTCRHVGIAVNGVSMKPVRAVGAAELLKGREPTPGLLEEAGARAAKEARPLSNIEGLAGYRGKMVRVLVRRALEGALQKASAGAR